MSQPTNRRPISRRDNGAVLPIVLIIIVVLGAVVAATATYATTTLRYGQTSESRTDRFAASQAGMDDAIEQLELRRGFSVCATATGTVSNPFPEQINGADVTVECGLTAGSLPSSDGFALAVTGVGVDASIPTLELENGGKPEINGPVYVHDPARMVFQQPTTLVEGDLWYEDTSPSASCAIPDPSSYVAGTTAFERSAIAVSGLNFDPPLTRGFYCVNRSWDQLFDPPPVNAAVVGLAAPIALPAVNADGCQVFEPGYYDAASAPVLTSNNYFKSGIYHFDNIGTVVFDKQVATFGNSLIQGFPLVANSPCDPVRTADSTDGATLYISGNTAFDMDKSDTGFEVGGRLQGNTLVAIHVLNTSLDPDTQGLFTSGPGAKREISMNGLLWAPGSALIFDTIPTKKAAALRGGAVIARLQGGVSAAASGFVISVPTSASSTQLLLESTAVNSRGETTVRVIADYRAGTGEIAPVSWRVCEPDGC